MQDVGLMRLRFEGVKRAWLGRDDDCECAMTGVEANGVLGHWAGQLDLLEWQQAQEVLLPFFSPFFPYFSCAMRCRGR